MFYYLRKKVCTTTNVMFDQQMQSLYERYMASNRDDFILKNDRDIFPIVLGHFMDCSTSWLKVDHVLFPIFLGKRRNHWVLARLSFQDRKIYLYNSLRTPLMSREARSTLQAYCEILPFFIELSGFYSIRTDIDFNSGPYIGTSNRDFYIVEEIHSLPFHDNKESGILMTVFSEHFIENTKIPSKLSVDLHRKRYSFFLYQHGIKKAKE